MPLGYSPESKRFIVLGGRTAFGQYRQPRSYDVLTLDADAARERFQRIHARFDVMPANVDLGGAAVRARGRDLEIVADGRSAELIERLRAWAPASVSTEALSLEEIFVATLEPGRSAA